MAVTCIYGRVQVPVIKFLRRTHSVDYVDVITGPCIVKTFAEAGDPCFERNLKWSQGTYREA